MKNHHSWKLTIDVEMDSEIVFSVENSTHATDDLTYNELYIKHTIQYLSRLLEERGHLFLNEAYDNLGLKRTSAGAVLGWIHTNNYTRFITYRFCDVSNNFVLNFGVPDVIFDQI